MLQTHYTEQLQLHARKKQSNPESSTNNDRECVYTCSCLCWVYSSTWQSLSRTQAPDNSNRKWLQISACEPTPCQVGRGCVCTCSWPAWASSST